MKIMLTAFALTVSFSATATPATDAAQKNYVQAIDRFNVGEVTRTDVAAAQLLSLKARLDAKEMIKIQYCYEAPEVAEILVAGMQEESRLGMREPAEVKASEKTKADVTSYCASRE